MKISVECSVSAFLEGKVLRSASKVRFLWVVGLTTKSGTSSLCNGDIVVLQKPMIDVAEENKGV